MTINEDAQNTFVPLISSSVTPESTSSAIEFTLSFSAGHQVTIKAAASYPIGLAAQPGNCYANSL